MTTQHVQAVSAAVSDYERLGGETAVAKVSSRLCDLVLHDEPLASYFDDMDLATFERHQRLLVTHVLGGPAARGHRELRKTHSWLPLDREHFERMMCYLAQALHHAGADADVIGRMGDALAAVESDVVTSSCLSGAKWTPLP